MKIFILITMIFCHIVDDYYLQGWLAHAKQKSYWIKNAPDPMYKYDYIIALLTHSFSWTFCIHIPYFIYMAYLNKSFYIFLFIVNIIIHAIVDNLKANAKKINLIEDQLIHLLQILITWFYLFIIK